MKQPVSEIKRLKIYFPNENIFVLDYDEHIPDSLNLENWPSIAKNICRIEELEYVGIAANEIFKTFDKNGIEKNQARAYYLNSGDLKEAVCLYKPFEKPSKFLRELVDNIESNILISRRNGERKFEFAVYNKKFKRIKITSNLKKKLSKLERYPNLEDENDIKLVIEALT